MTSPDPMSVRLIFEYEGDQVRLVAQQPVDVVVTGSDLTREQVPGHYVEVRAGDDATLSRLRVPTAMSASAEVFPAEPGQPIVRTDLPEPRGAFTVVVPAPAEADHVSVVRIAHGATGLAPAGPIPGGFAPREGVVELASFPLVIGGAPS
jgi:hypothetical protein